MPLNMQIKKYLKSALRSASYIAVSFSYPGIVFADVLGDRVRDLEASTDEASLIQNFYELAIPAAVMTLVALLAYGGFKFITSQGNPEKLGDAKEVLMNAILGFTLIVLSIAFMALLQGVLNLDLGGF